MNLKKSDIIEGMFYFVISIKICGVPIMDEIDRILGAVALNIFDVLLNAILVICLLVILLKSKYSSFKTTGGIFFLAFLMGYCYIMFPQYTSIFNTQIYGFFILGSLGYVCGVAVNKPDMLIKHLYIISLVSLFILAYQPFLGNFNQIGMMYGYKVIVSLSVILLYSKIQKASKLNYLIVFAFSIMCIFFSSRGALLLLIAYFFILMFIKNSKFNKVKNAYLIIFAALIFTVVEPYIIDALNNLSPESSISTKRTVISKIDDSVLFSNNGRVEIYEVYWTLIDSYPKGVGIAVDRILTGFPFPHNIYIELLAHFGVILGNLVMLILVIMLFKGYFRQASLIKSQLILLLIFTMFFRLFFSNSYLNLMYPIMLTLGLCIPDKPKVGQKALREI
jgi:teichuronic acid biosynthesis protein TuaE